MKKKRNLSENIFPGQAKQSKIPSAPCRGFSDGFSAIKSQGAH